MSNVKYAAYSYATKQELIDDVVDMGWEYPEGFPENGAFVDKASGETLNYSYAGKIVVNFPRTYEEPPAPEWTPQYSSDVYIHSARQGNLQLPAPHKLGGNELKYFTKYVRRFSGEPPVEGEVIAMAQPPPTNANTKAEIKAWLTANSIAWTAGMTKAQLLALIP